MSTLFRQLIDDAAVFPPGSFPLAEALRRRDLRSDADWQYVGPLLLPPALVAEALEHPTSVRIGVVGRPGTPASETLAAARAVAHHRTHELAEVHIAFADGWREALGVTTVVVEVPHDGFEPMLDELAAAGSPVAAKFRTGSTPANPVPSPAQLAAFVVGCTTRGLPFRLTGGMHHALTHDEPSERQLGVLNVLAATASAVEGRPEEVPALLDRSDSAVMVAAVRSLTEETARSVRDAFRSYGCCDVDDPIRELRQLHLVPTTQENP